MARSERRRYPLTLALFDVDSFKAINDQFGHAMGDLVLKEFGGRLSKAVREADLAARLGGDEFMLLLTECDSSQMPRVLKRLEAIEVRSNNQRIQVQFSVGFREYMLGQQPSELIEEADKALYANKQERKARAAAPAPEPASQTV